MRISSLDHFVLTVKNIDETVSFYEKVLGMEKQIFADNRVALKYGRQKINLHLYGHEYEPKAQYATPGSADLCFLTDTPITEAMQHVNTLGVTILEGPVQRTGATGPIVSFYFRDPDANLIEVANINNTQ